MYIFIHVYAVRLAPSLSVSLPLPHPLPSPLAFPIYLIYYNKGLYAPYNFFFPLKLSRLKHLAVEVNNYFTTSYSLKVRRLNVYNQVQSISCAD